MADSTAPMSRCYFTLTPVGQGLIAASTGWPLILVGRLVSWFGKGLRGPLRDAIVTARFWAGPRPARARTWADPAGPFRLVFWLTLIPGLLAVLACLLLVRDPEHSPNPALEFVAALRALPARFKRYLGAVGVFGSGDCSHSLLILAATQLLTPSVGVVRAARTAGLLYVWRNVVQVATSYPVGVFADRYGPPRVLIIGYMLGVSTAVLTALAFALNVDSVTVLAVIFFVGGLYVAVQEALESAVAASMVDAERLAMSDGALGVVNGTAKFISSAAVGVLWTAASPVIGFGAAAVLMAAGTIALIRAR